MVAHTAEKRFGALGRMGLVAAIHVAALFVIGRSLGIVPPILSEPPPDIKTTIIERPPPVDVPPPATNPPLVRQEIFVPPPEVPAVETETAPPLLVEQRPPETIVEETGSAVPQPVITQAGLDSRHPLTQPYYPPARIRANDEGAVDLQVYVLPNGRVGDARVLKSSGFEDFDRAAIEEARRSWRLKPATRDGTPMEQWYSLRVVFKLKNQQQ
jgi:protein TonB